MNYLNYCWTTLVNTVLYHLIDLSVWCEDFKWMNKETWQKQTWCFCFLFKMSGFRYHSLNYIFFDIFTILFHYIHCLLLFSVIRYTQNFITLWNQEACFVKSELIAGKRLFLLVLWSFSCLTKMTSNSRVLLLLFYCFLTVLFRPVALLMFLTLVRLNHCGQSLLCWHKSDPPVHFPASTNV